MRARRDVDVDADVPVVERRDRLLVDAAGGDRRECRDRHGHFFAESRLRRDAFRGAQLRIGQHACVRVVLEQTIVERRHAGHEDVGTRQVATDPAASSPSRLTSTEPLMPSEPGEAICSPYSRSRVRSTSSSSTSITTSGRALSIAAIRRAAAATRSGVSLQRDGVDGRHAARSGGRRRRCAAGR